MESRLPVDTGDFRLLSRECLSGLQSLREQHRFLRGMVAWVGYAQIGVRYRRNPRAAGSTKYPLRKMLSFAWTAATSFSTLPLRISMFLGMSAGLLGIEETLRAFYALARGHVVPGWTSLMVVTSILGSAILISIGIVGQYVGRIYEESKGRPLYLVARTLNVEEGARAARRRRRGTGGRARIDSQHRSCSAAAGSSRVPGALRRWRRPPAAGARRS